MWNMFNSEFFTLVEKHATSLLEYSIEFKSDFVHSGLEGFPGRHLDPVMWSNIFAQNQFKIELNVHGARMLEASAKSIPGDLSVKYVNVDNYEHQKHVGYFFFQDFLPEAEPPEDMCFHKSAKNARTSQPTGSLLFSAIAESDLFTVSTPLHVALVGMYHAQQHLSLTFDPSEFMTHALDVYYSAYGLEEGLKEVRKCVEMLQEMASDFTQVTYSYNTHVTCVQKLAQLVQNLLWIVLSNARVGEHCEATDLDLIGKSGLLDNVYHDEDTQTVIVEPQRGKSADMVIYVKTDVTYKRSNTAHKVAKRFLLAKQLTK